MKYILLFTLSLFVTLHRPTQAHPVSFQNSVGIMGYHAPNLTHNQVNYSVKHWFAIGAHHLRIPTSERPKHASFIVLIFS